MKKIIKNSLIIMMMVCLTAVCAFLALRYAEVELPFLEEPTTAATTTAPTTAETTTKKPTTTKATTTTETTTEVTTTAPTTTAPPKITVDDMTLMDYMPLSLYCAAGDIKHCQGMAIDLAGGYTYYSYTTSLVKGDLEGNIVGSVVGITGHLGDIAFNPKDGMLYASLNPPGKQALYTAVINVSKINKQNMSALNPKIFRTVHLKAVWKDYSALVETNIGSMYRRYGVSGTDAMCFGPSFSTGKGNYLTISCGTTPQPQRTDNDYQVLVQYDVTDWWDKYAQPMKNDTFHRIGPEGCHGKFFAYTGNTNYGVQTMTYFEELNLWLMFVYPTTKTDFTPYTLFIVDGDIPPRTAKLKGQVKEDKQKVLTLYKDGEYDKNRKIYGWYAQNGAKGIQYIGGGMFYIIHPYKTWYGTQTAVAYLYVWDASKSDPFTLATDVKPNYTISKKVTTTKAQKTTKQTTEKNKTTTAEKPEQSATEKADSLIEYIFGR